MNEFVVDKITRETLEEYGYSSNVSDEVMKQIASVLRHVFRETILDELPQIAEEYNIPKCPKQSYKVTRTYRSLINETGNRHYSKHFNNQEEAIAQFKRWQDKELSRLIKSGSEYEIENDEADFFKVYWSTKREMMSILIY